MCRCAHGCPKSPTSGARSLGASVGGVFELFNVNGGIQNQVFIIEHQILLTTGSFSQCPSAGFDAWDRLGWSWDCMVGDVWVQDAIWANLWECQFQTCEEDHPNKYVPCTGMHQWASCS